MQHKRVGIAPEFGHDERDALRHQAGHERDIAGEPVELRDQDAALRGLGGGQCGCELRSPVHCVGALAGLCFNKLSDDGELLGFGEVPDGGLFLGLDSLWVIWINHLGDI
jgi:hypothetical protein